MIDTAEQKADRIRKEILDRFYWDSRIADFANIEILVQDDRVTLTGSAPSHLSRRHAEMATRGVPGVRAVDNQLRVRFNDALHIPSDREIEYRVHTLLHWNSTIDEAKITVAARAGRVTLTGTVASYYQKYRAEELAADVIGVTAVDNRLAVVPGRAADDEALGRGVLAALADRLGRDAGSLTVMIRNGVVTLTGTVPDAFAAQAVRTVVHVIRGVVDIHDLLVVAAAG